MANFNQAIKWMKEGKKVRRPDFFKGDYSYVYEGVVMDNKDNLALTIEQLEATDWEIYCEEHEWINYDEIITPDDNAAEFYENNPQFGWRGCPHPSSYKNDKFCKNCGNHKEHHHAGSPSFVCKKFEAVQFKCKCKCFFCQSCEKPQIEMKIKTLKEIIIGKYEDPIPKIKQEAIKDIKYFQKLLNELPAYFKKYSHKNNEGKELPK
ncbi:hypothetical protein LCGC14_2044490, partial [marine sediment metagenome]